MVQIRPQQLAGCGTRAAEVRIRSSCVRLMPFLRPFRTVAESEIAGMVLTRTITLAEDIRRGEVKGIVR